MYKYTVIIISCFLFIFTAQAEVIKDIKIEGNTRVSNETIKIYGDIKINEDYSEKDLNRINCFSNEGNQWQNTETSLKNNKLLIKFRDKFKDRRGRINCSLNDNGNWRWLGLQFTINNN